MHFQDFCDSEWNGKGVWVLNDKLLQVFLYVFDFEPPVFGKGNHNQNKIHTEETTLSMPQKQVRNTFA